jgi:ribose/xylose/arabinose/galactoside ABC-type transport system permease subunit
LITTFIATLASGFTFAGIATLFVSATILTMYHGNFSEFFAVYVPIIIITAVFNAVIVQILYIPLSRVVKREWNDQSL